MFPSEEMVKMHAELKRVADEANANAKRAKNIAHTAEYTARAANGALYRFESDRLAEGITFNDAEYCVGPPSDEIRLSWER